MSGEYLTELEIHKASLEKHTASIARLNSEENDLKWATTIFSTATAFAELITPRYDLWALVNEYDCLIKKWKYQ